MFFVVVLEQAEGLDVVTLGWATAWTEAVPSPSSSTLMN